MTDQYLLYVGTYTRPAPHVENAQGEGIYNYRFNRITGELTYLGVQRGIDDPSFLAISSDGCFLTAVSETEKGTINSYEINRETGELTYLTTQPSMGSSPAYITLDQSNQYVLAANYGGELAVVMLPLDSSGELAPASSVHPHPDQPAGTVPDRQEKAHAHCIVPDLTNRFALVCDLGLDKVLIYRMDLEIGSLVLHEPPYYAVEPGAGPRHLAFHPALNSIYVINELNSSVSVLGFDPKDGTLDHLQTLSTLPDDFTGENTGADIHVTPSGRFVYASNRGHDSIAAYAVQDGTGRLGFIGHYSTKGRTPRGFLIDPTGMFLLVANQDSDSIVVFRINQDTGVLEDTGIVVSCRTPVCLRMVAAE